jgi:hypothetical protein
MPLLVLKNDLAVVFQVFNLAGQKWSRHAIWLNPPGLEHQ